MSTIENTQTEAGVVSTLAQQAIDPVRIDTGEVYAVADGMGGIRVVDTDAYALSPRHTSASRTVTDALSFVTYVNRHQRPGTEVYAHTSSSSVVAVIDSHEGSDSLPGWQKHKLTLGLEHTKAWLAWTAVDLGAKPSAWMDQQQFAEFIEDRALDVIEPDHARLIELATKFEATTKVEFGSAVRLDNGEVKFEYTETVGPKKGNKGGIDLPKELKLGLRPYIGGPIYYVFASLRYRIRSEGLVLGIALQRPENILEAAFADIVTEIRDGIEEKDGRPGHPGIADVPIFYGKP
ncbi:DUF2303 family protein [Microbacterium aurantiacum]|uniref:YfdQ family protein n=1 Tax=Microbacterium aurantiacum TaxID=162393 RepID=A0ABT8FRM1_9MICO|nr:DUF2303 family protein [Microbacterium aurantiacum]MDN4463924.1 YfdQ family protein [Microbacterium aurantiacum]